MGTHPIFESDFDCLTEYLVQGMTEKAEKEDMGTCLLVMGMAGSGKTTFVQRLTANLTMSDREKPPYVINLDPAVAELQFPTNIDIRDTVKYKEVMTQYGLGPNGAIMTSLNLFSTKFDQVLEIVEKRASATDHVIIDTPGQIEVFTWSASGSIITETLATTIPTVVLYVMDVAKCTSPVTFMSNMMYACSILYKTELPFVIVLNKADIVDHSFALEWMRDYESFLDAINKEESYISNLSRSLSLVLDDFYSTLRAVGFSSVTGAGFDELLKEIEKARKEYFSDFLPDLEVKREKAREKEERRKREHIQKLKDDLTPSASRYASTRSSKAASRADSPQRGLIPPSDLLDYQAEDEGDSTNQRAKSANERLEEESFERFIQSNLEARRK